MTTHRRYTKRQKAGAVTAALASSVQAAADSTGIPRKTIAYWMESPEFAELRQKTREEMAEGWNVLGLLAQRTIVERIPTMENRDLLLLAGISADKGQLLSGGATSRTEHRDITEGWDDHERSALKDAIDAELAKREVEA